MKTDDKTIIDSSFIDFWLEKIKGKLNDTQCKDLSDSELYRCLKDVVSPKQTIKATKILRDNNILKFPFCEEKNCQEKAHKFVLEGKESWLCFKHATESGFCFGCGEFWGGTDEWEFPNAHGCIHGYCPYCSDEIKADCGEYDE